MHGVPAHALHQHRHKPPQRLHVARDTIRTTCSVRAVKQRPEIHKLWRLRRHVPNSLPLRRQVFIKRRFNVVGTHLAVPTVTPSPSIVATRVPLTRQGIEEIEDLALNVALQLHPLVTILEGVPLGKDGSCLLFSNGTRDANALTFRRASASTPRPRIRNWTSAFNRRHHSEHLRQTGLATIFASLRDLEEATFQKRNDGDANARIQGIRHVPERAKHSGCLTLTAARPTFNRTFAGLQRRAITTHQDLPHASP
jgi:hypothetical protein